MGSLLRQGTLAKDGIGSGGFLSLSFEELQSELACGSGKFLGSMNMDEFLSTVWDRSDPTGAGGLAVLDEQPARRLPTPPPESGAVSHPDYSGKTVEEVWQLIHGAVGARGPEAQNSLASVTLGSFLQSAGLGSLAMDLPDVPELQNLPSRTPISPRAAEARVSGVLSGGLGGSLGFTPDLARASTAAASAPPLASSTAPGGDRARVRVEHPTPARRGSPAGAAVGPAPVFAAPAARPLSAPAASPARASGASRAGARAEAGAAAPGRGSNPSTAGSGQPPSSSPALAAPLTPQSIAVVPQAGPSTTRPNSAASDAPPRAASRQPLTRAERASALVPPPPPVPRAGRQRKRKDPDVVDERTARLQKRMVKNRESAARSRQRKQQYTAELETQVEELKSINRDLLEQVISHCPPPDTPHVPVTGGAPLRRTRTTPL